MWPYFWYLGWLEIINGVFGICTPNSIFHPKNGNFPHYNHWRSRPSPVLVYPNQVCRDRKVFARHLPSLPHSCSNILINIYKPWKSQPPFFLVSKPTLGVYHQPKGTKWRQRLPGQTYSLNDFSIGGSPSSATCMLLKPQNSGTPIKWSTRAKIWSYLWQVLLGWGFPLEGLSPAQAVLLTNPGGLHLQLMYLPRRWNALPWNKSSGSAYGSFQLTWWSFGEPNSTPP